MKEANQKVRARIIKSAAKLLAGGGREAVSSRTVSVQAGVQAPTIYRQFGDMRGLLDAVALDVLTSYVHGMGVQRHTADPVDDLRRGWEQHIEFGLANPAVYSLVYGDPFTMADAPAARDDLAILRELVSRVAQAGKLRVGVEHAVRILAAAGSGVTLSLIAFPPDKRDLQLSRTMREAVFAAILNTPDRKSEVVSPCTKNRLVTHAVALRAMLGEAAGAFSSAEQHLLDEWLERLSEFSPQDSRVGEPKPRRVRKSNRDRGE